MTIINKDVSFYSELSSKTLLKIINNNNKYDNIIIEEILKKRNINFNNKNIKNNIKDNIKDNINGGYNGKEILDCINLKNDNITECFTDKIKSINLETSEESLILLTNKRTDLYVFKNNNSTSKFDFIDNDKSDNLCNVISFSIYHETNKLIKLLDKLEEKDEEYEEEYEDDEDDDEYFMCRYLKSVFPTHYVLETNENEKRDEKRDEELYKMCPNKLYKNKENIDNFNKYGSIIELCDTFIYTYLLPIYISIKNVSVILKNWIVRIYLHRSIINLLNLLKSIKLINQYNRLNNILIEYFNFNNVEVYMVNDNVINLHLFRSFRFLSFQDREVNISVSKDADGIITLYECTNLLKYSQLKNDLLYITEWKDTLTYTKSYSKWLKFYDKYFNNETKWSLLAGLLSINFTFKKEYFLSKLTEIINWKNRIIKTYSKDSAEVLYVTLGFDEIFLKHLFMDIFKTFKDNEEFYKTDNYEIMIYDMICFIKQFEVPLNNDIITRTDKYVLSKTLNLIEEHKKNDTHMLNKRNIEVHYKNIKNIYYALANDIVYLYYKNINTQLSNDIVSNDIISLANDYIDVIEDKLKVFRTCNNYFSLSIQMIDISEYYNIFLQEFL